MTMKMAAPYKRNRALITCYDWCLSPVNTQKCFVKASKSLLASTEKNVRNHV